MTLKLCYTCIKRGHYSKVQVNRNYSHGKADGKDAKKKERSIKKYTCKICGHLSGGVIIEPKVTFIRKER